MPDKHSVSLKNIQVVGSVRSSFSHRGSYFFYVFTRDGCIDYAPMYKTKFEATVMREVLIGKLGKERRGGG